MDDFGPSQAQFSGGLPPEYQQRLESAAKQRRLAEMLMRMATQNNQPQQMGRMASRASPLSALVPALTGFLASKTEAGASSEMGKVRSDFTEAERKAVEGFQALPAAEQDRQAQTSQFNRVRDIGKALQAQRMKQAEGAVGILKERDIPTALDINRTGQLPQPGYKPPELPGPTFGTSPTGAAYGIETDLKGQKSFKFEPKGTTVNVGGEKQEAAAQKALGGEIPKILSTATEGAKKAYEGIQSADRIMSLLKDPATITGFGAGPLAGLANLGAALGFDTAEAAGKTQALMAEQAGQTLNEVKRLPGAITEKERPFLEMAAAGKIDWTPASIQRLAEITKAANHNAIIEYNKQYNGALSTPGAEQGGAMYPFPIMEYNMTSPNIKDRGMDRVKYEGAAPISEVKKPVLPEGFDKLTPAQQARYKQLKGIQ